MPNRQRLYRTHAVVLRRRDFRDADRILTIFTPNYGKLEVIAKGVRKTTSRKAGHLELFSHCTLMLAKGRTWDIVTEVVGVESFRNIRQDLDKISLASYISELIDCFSESDDENQPMWDLLLVTLQELDQTSSAYNSRLLRHWFEMSLLSLTGFQPQLFQCLNCDEELAPVSNYMSLSEGGVFCPTCGQGRRDLELIEADVLKVLRFLQSRPWGTVRQVNIRPHILAQVDNLLYRYLLIILERQLKSVDFMRRLQHMAQAAAPAAPVAATADASLQEDVADLNAATMNDIGIKDAPQHAHT
ncbi:MAG: DNA repair protein RecO [Caldilineaceae bacterium]|nr:DNA repair protein RecO [Caldilineaceae bacterium]